MIRKYKYTVISLLFAVFFIFGSMTAMNGILKIRETQLLTESGRTEVESPVREWKGWGNVNENVVGSDTESERHDLTMKQIEEAVNSWNSRTEVTLHDPVAGQISMAEAIEAGKRWLVEMEMSKEMDTASLSISAELGVSGQKEDTVERLEAYFSFWTVTYSNQSMSAILYLNAVTGKVWGAEITLYEKQPKKLYHDRLRLFVELAGLQESDNSFVIVIGETRSEIAIKESRLYAQQNIYETTYETVKMDGNEKFTIYNCYVTISYRFIMDQK